MYFGVVFVYVVLSLCILSRVDSLCFYVCSSSFMYVFISVYLSFCRSVCMYVFLHVGISVLVMYLVC